MKVYNQDEWTKIHGNASGGRLCIEGVNLAKDFTIESLRVTTIFSASLQAWGVLNAEDITEIQGKKRFEFTASGVNLLVDAEGDSRFRPIKPQGLENPKVINFSKWTKDYIEYNNSTHSQLEDKIAKMEITGCEIDFDGIIRWLNARVTWRGNYGEFGPLVTEKHIEISRDILSGAYGMRRNDFIHDDWTPNCCGNNGHRAYFTEGFDVVYADDGRYTINGKPPIAA